MAMVVKNNMSAISTLNTLNRNSAALTKSLAKVSSGMRVNGAADDASGYAISERMRVQIRSLDQDNRNTQNGNSMMKVAEGAVSSTVEILKTLKEKVINAANDSNTDEDRQTIQKELNQSLDQIDDNANMTYNGKYLVDGTKNNKTAVTCTHLTNLSLSTDSTESTALTALKNRTGDALHIKNTDNVTISYVNQGKTYTTTFSVGSQSLSDILSKEASYGTDKFTASFTYAHENIIGTDGTNNTVYTANRENGITLQNAKTGVDNQIAGLTISISDNTGAIKKAANAALDAFSETIRAQNASEDNALVFQTGTKANQAIKVGLTDMRTEALGLKGSDGTKLNISTQKFANAAINVLDNALQKALDQQTTIGAVQSRMEYTSSNLVAASENVTASESTIRDADMAKEMTEYTKNNVLLQAAQSMLSQANQNSSAVLSLLQ
jgi:flagellin